MRPLLDVRPGAQRAVAARQFHAQRVHVDVLPHAGGIDAGELGEQLPRPGVEVAGAAGQQGLAEHAPDGEAVTPLRGRRGVQAQQVPAPRVAHDPIDLRERQRRRACSSSVQRTVPPRMTNSVCEKNQSAAALWPAARSCETSSPPT
jgi:hypothetical protein